MEKFKEALVQFADSNPNLFPNDAGNVYPVLIEQRFSQFFSDPETPNHPPYAAMIYRAILELNKKRGSSEKSISKYIKKEYAELPWAHSTLLKHHLEKLCESKEIHITQKQRYLLGGADSETEKNSSGSCMKSEKQKSKVGAELEPRRPKKIKKKEKCQLDIQDDEGIRLRKRKRKHRLKCKRKGSKRVKEHEINADAELQKDEVTNDKSQDQESTRDNSGYGNLDQIETKKNAELLQPEESPDAQPLLEKNGKRVLTRSQLKITVNGEEQIELLNPISSKLMLQFPAAPSSTELHDPISSQQDKQPKKLRLKDKPTYKRQCTHQKPSEFDKDEVLCVSKSAGVSGKSQKSAEKGKYGSKKGQLKVKSHGRHKMTRRSKQKHKL